jgi:hypothetical protein
MRKFLGVSLAVGALTIVSGVAVAQLDHGSGHDVNGAKGHAMKAGHHEMMQNHMSKAGEDEKMTSHMGKTGHDVKSHAGKASDAMKDHAGKAGHE